MLLLIQVVSKTKNAADFSPIPKEEWPKLDVRTDFTHFPAKLVRLAFHDCLKYDDKSGGCDGKLKYNYKKHDLLTTAIIVQVA